MAVTDPADSTFWDDISQLLGKTAAGAGSGRAAQANYQNARDALSARLYDIAQNARTAAAGQRIQAANQQLATDKFRQSLPGLGAQEAVRGALIQNAQPSSLNLGASHITPGIKFTGGTSPASFTPE